MKILIGCEYSGVVRRACAALGHDAWSCDLLPSEDDSLFHIQGDVRDILGDGWDMAIFHPDCTYLCSSGLHWNNKTPGRQEKTEEALEFVELLLDADIEKIALENPVGCIGTRIRPADQYVQPNQFGHDASKKTGLWLKNLDPLIPTCHVAPRIIDGKPRWANQTDSGQNKLGPSADRWKERARTYDGIGKAFALQWAGRIKWTR